MNLFPLHPSRKKILIFICVVTALLIAGLILLSVAVPSPPYPCSKAQLIRMMAGLELTVASEAAIEYLHKFGKLPTNARELGSAILFVQPPGQPEYDWIKKDTHEAIDPWGTPLSIQISSTDFCITSAGPDKIFGTNDDIVEKRDLSKP